MSEQVMTASAAGLTVEEFWALPQVPNGERHELIDGEVVVAAAPVEAGVLREDDLAETPVLPGAVIDLMEVFGD